MSSASYQADNPDPLHRFWHDSLEDADPEVAAIIGRELGRQRDRIELIASENIASPAVLEATGSVFTNKYAEGYPGRRYYGGCEYADQVETLAIERAKALFGCEFANVQPNSGSQMNQAVFLALMTPGDTFMVVYRAKFAPTIFAARQVVSHGHIRVNGVKCNIASRKVLPGDVVSLGEKAKEMALIIEAQSLPEREIPDYVSPDGNDKVTFTRVPKLDEVPYPVTMEPNLVVEFYSR